MISTAVYSLFDYNATKDRLASLVRAARQLLAGESSEDQWHELLVKLAEDRFNLAVVGQFKRGKSTLMNALVGRDLLPTGMLPSTSVITTLCYGPEARAFLRRKGWVLEPEIPLDDLAAYVSEAGNPGNEKGILEARIELPEKLLRQGLYISDTPGVGSARRENTETTYAFLPEADAVILVTSVEAPLSAAEQEFLGDVRQLVRKLFVVVNKTDLLGAEETDPMLDYISSGIGQILGSKATRLYPLSARVALEAKANGDDARLESSGLPQFEAALAAFLANDRGRTFLVALLDRALRLLRERGEDSRGDDHLQAASAQSDGARDRFAELIKDMEALRSTLLEGSRVTASEQTARAAPADMNILRRQVSATRVTTPGRPRQAAQAGCCPICAAESQAVFDFFAQWQYVLSTEAEGRRAFAAARGFCHVHTWQFQQMASPQGIAEGYLPLVEATAVALQHLAGVPSSTGALRIRDLVPRAHTCPACEVMREVARSRIGELLAALQADQGSAQYGRARGICLPHLQMVLSEGPPGKVTDRLLSEQAQFCEELAEDMRRYLLKRDARRRGLINDNEQRAWWRALVELMGERTAQYWWPD